MQRRDVMLTFWLINLLACLFHLLGRDFLGFILGILAAPRLHSFFLNLLVRLFHLLGRYFLGFICGILAAARLHLGILNRCVVFLQELGIPWGPHQKVRLFLLISLCGGKDKSEEEDGDENTHGV